LYASIRTNNFTLRNYSIKKTIPLFDEVGSDYFPLILTHLHDLYFMNKYDLQIYKNMWCFKTINGCFLANDEEIEFINKYLKKYTLKPTKKNIENISKNLNLFFFINTKLENFIKYEKKNKNINYWKFLVNNLNFIKTINNDKNLKQLPISTFLNSSKDFFPKIKANLLKNKNYFQNI